MEQQHVADVLQNLLQRAGASLIGYADLTELPTEVRRNYPRAVSIGVALNPAIVSAISDGPTAAYEAEYNRVNQLLGTLAETAAECLRQQGYDAFPAVATQTQLNQQTLSTQLPHKTAATRAGFGWIGKCALLITKEYGSAIRLITVLTNADLPVGAAINESSCGECRKCLDVCPGHAPSGNTWSAGMARAEFFDAFACYRTTARWMESRGLQYHICGMCIAACPWTQRYLGKAR